MEQEWVRTTIVMSRKMHDKVKIMSVLTRSSISKIMRIALKKELEELNKGKDVK